jgi:excisionase family DNA binding protein
MDLRGAADALGVHYQTAYAWVRQGLLPARKVGRGYQISDDDVTAFAARRSLGQEPIRPVRVRDWTLQAGRLYAALGDGEETLARHRLERLAGGVTLTDLCEHVIAPALRRIGDDWAAGRVSIAQEHRASAICERLIATHAQQPGGRPRGVAVVTTPPGERHGLPALMAAVCLREDHWLVHHLAADLPVDEVTRLADEADAGLVVLSAAMTETARQAQDEARSIAAIRPGLKVLAGRPGDSLHDLRALAESYGRPAAGSAREKKESSAHGPLPGGPAVAAPGRRDIRLPRHIQQRGGNGNPGVPAAQQPDPGPVGSAPSSAWCPS